MIDIILLLLLELLLLKNWYELFFIVTEYVYLFVNYVYILKIFQSYEIFLFYWFLRYTNLFQYHIWYNYVILICLYSLNMTYFWTSEFSKIFSKIKWIFLCWLCLCIPTKAFATLRSLMGINLKQRYLIKGYYVLRYLEASKIAWLTIYIVTIRISERSP